MMMGRSLLGVVSLALFAAACGRSGAGARSPEASTFRVVGVGAAVDPTVRPARLLPESVDDAQGYGSEPAGGTRAITFGLRVVTTKEGAILAAEDRLPQAPQTTVALPERLGGGFLFVLGTTVWRTDRWLGPAKPIFTSASSVQTILPGLDRVYLRAQNAWLSIDGRTGHVLDLGPFPASPTVSSFAAADGWRAAAVTDLRGLVATFDAGATWKALDLSIEPKQVLVSGDSLAVGGLENNHVEAWFEVRGDGSIARLGAPPREAKGKLAAAPPPRPAYPGSGYPIPPTFPTFAPPPPSNAKPPPSDEVREEPQDLGTRIFGKRPLAAAIEDGWPLTDGTAVVARDGALGRVRLSDGALVEVAQNAYPLKPSRCHPVSLTRANAAGAFGFVCGEPRGATILYAYEPLKGRLAEIKRFDRPRVVTSSGNGALAVRGPCAEDADPSPRETAAPRAMPAPIDKTDDKDKRDRHDDDDDDDDKTKSKAPARAKPDDKTVPKPDAKTLESKKKDERPPLVVRPAAPELHPFCILGHDNTWREVHVRGDVGGERVVVLADGTIAVVSPPQTQGTPARLTILERGKATTVPIVFPKVTADVARVLRLGLWLDGFEERRPGVIGGWIEAGGAMLGLEIALDGKATPGQFVRDAGMPFVSGRYGLGWTAARRGYETTDGGMTWTSVELPDPLVPTAKVERRACGPIGCVAAGWMRVGWGEAKKSPVPAAPPPYRATVSASPPQLTLACEPLVPTPPPPPAPKPRKEAPQPAPNPPTRRPSFSSPPVLAPAPGAIGGASELQPFFSQPAATLRDGERGINLDVQDLAGPRDRGQPRVGTLGRVYAWGPKGGDWDTQGKWQVKWLSPFAGWPEVRASAPVLPPQAVVDLTKGSSYGGFGYPYAYGQNFALAAGDDPSHALLVLRRTFGQAGVSVFELEADRAPIEIRRADGEPFGEIDGLTRAAGRWFASTSPPPGTTTPFTTIWHIEGGVARELTRVPRTGADRTTGTLLARRSDGRAIGLVVDGQPTAERSTATRWLLPIDLESGQLGEPELLGYVDLAGRTLEACSDDAVGWTLDTSLPGTSVRLRLPQGSGSMHSIHARVRLTSSRACVERLAGMYDGQSADRAAQLARPAATKSASTATRPGEILVTPFSAQVRYPIRCTLAK
jgi:hypothetical protein